MKRVAAYCRVSTEKDDQLNSLENQKRYFEEYINKNLEWQFVGIYVDEGISGTSVNKRKGFKQMIKDAENKKFDLLLTKEISRFARNTLDSIFYTRKLKQLGIGVYFMNDNINTLDPDSELRLTIMASIAQEESRKISDRVKWGQKRSMERGVVFGTGVLGYNICDGKISINEDEAKTVRLIFDLYLNHGMGTHVLCKELENRGIRSPSGSDKWKNASLLRILKNEKYIGILKQKKAITVDYLSHKRKRNIDDEDYIIIEDNHESIIDNRTFYRVQEEISRRQNYTFDMSKYSNRYAWSGKLECGYCNSKFKRKIWNGKKNPKIVWQCANNMKYGSEKMNAQNEKVGCNCKAIHEAVLEQMFLVSLNTIVENKQEIIKNVRNAILEAISEVSSNTNDVSNVSAEIDKINNRKRKLIELYTDDGITRDEFNRMNEAYNKQLEALQDSLSKIQVTDNRAEELSKKLQEIDKIIMEIAEMEVFSGEVCKQVLNKVVIKSREEMFFFINSDSEKILGISIPLSITPYRLLKGLCRSLSTRRVRPCSEVRYSYSDMGELAGCFPDI